ncbi:hypothetical protein ACFVZH_39690 [Streptomyces sp. NPDC059534]|uniref:hypothetical protein n=1 Tax=Streptomyces sp. NPDC059534 TaxID=3346859 RepID=UPI00368D2E22
MPRTVQTAAYALVLLALAHPALVPPLFGTLGLLLGAVAAVVGWALAHLSLTLTLAATTLVLRGFPSFRGWLVRSWVAWVASVAAVAPVKA